MSDPVQPLSTSSCSSPSSSPLSRSSRLAALRVRHSKSKLPHSAPFQVHFPVKPQIKPIAPEKFKKIIQQEYVSRYLASMGVTSPAAHALLADRLQTRHLYIAHGYRNGTVGVGHTDRVKRRRESQRTRDASRSKSKESSVSPARGDGAARPTASHATNAANSHQQHTNRTSTSNISNSLLASVLSTQELFFNKIRHDVLKQRNLSRHDDVAPPPTDLPPLLHLVSLHRVLLAHAFPALAHSWRSRHREGEREERERMEEEERSRRQQNEQKEEVFVIDKAYQNIHIIYWRREESEKKEVSEDADYPNDSNSTSSSPTPSPRSSRLSSSTTLALPTACLARPPLTSDNIIRDLFHAFIHTFNQFREEMRQLKDGANAKSHVFAHSDFHFPPFQPLNLLTFYSASEFKELLNQTQTVMVSKKNFEMVALLVHYVYWSLFSDYTTVSPSSVPSVQQLTEVRETIKLLWIELSEHNKRHKKQSIFCGPLLLDSITTVVLNIYHLTYPAWFRPPPLELGEHLSKNQNPSMAQVTDVLIFKLINELFSPNFIDNKWKSLFHTTSKLVDMVFPHAISHEARVIRQGQMHGARSLSPRRLAEQQQQQSNTVTRLDQMVKAKQKAQHAKSILSPSLSAALKPDASSAPAPHLSSPRHLSVPDASIRSHTSSSSISSARLSSPTSSSMSLAATPTLAHAHSRSSPSTDFAPVSVRAALSNLNAHIQTLNHHMDDVPIAPSLYVQHAQAHDNDEALQQLTNRIRANSFQVALNQIKHRHAHDQYSEDLSKVVDLNPSELHHLLHERKSKFQLAKENMEKQRLKIMSARGGRTARMKDQQQQIQLNSTQHDVSKS